MHRINCVLLSGFLLCLWFIPLETIASAGEKTIVVFLPLNANLPAYQNFMDGFRTTVSAGYDEPCNIMVEYLDLGRLPADVYARHIVDLYNEKLKQTRCDLIITLAPFAYPILKKFGLEALEKTPVITIELDPPVEPPSPSPANNLTLEIKLKIDVSKTVENAFMLFPENKDVYIVSGNSVTDQYFNSLISKSAADLKPTHKIIVISGGSLDSTIRVIRTIPKNSIVFIPAYLSGKSNIPFSTPEAIGIISKYCNAPVFPIFDSFNRTNGGIGGYVFSFFNLGKQTGNTAVAILNGKKPAGITVNAADFYQYIYDWKQLKRWHLLNSALIPSNSIFINKEVDFFSQYRWQILIVVFFILSQTVLILYLYKLNRRQKVIVKQQSETKDLFLKIFREERLLRMVELTASLSHELNQPLTAILYNAQAGIRFLKSGKLDSRQAEEIFGNIIEDDKRAGELIGSVKSLMKLENREKGKVNVNKLVTETVGIFNAEAIKLGIHIQYKLPADPLFVFGDKVQLQQVLLNFMLNAAAAMENTDPEKKILEIVQRTGKGSITLSVRDCGPGKIFKPFITTKKTGFGIGLAVSQSIIKNHDGEIRAENIPGGGAEFSFKLRLIDNGQ
jgi:signal transduction histidine kinase